MKNLALLLSLLLIIGTSCDKRDEELSGESKIISVKLKSDSEIQNIDVVISNDSVKITVPPSVNLSNLTPFFSLDGISISPASGIAKNFTKPVEYTVTAEDGTQKKYIVSIIHSRHIVYLGTNQKFYALNPLNGKIVWQTPGTLNFNYSHPTYQNGLVYAGCIDNNMYAFDAMTGDIKWTYQIEGQGIESPPAIALGKIFFGGNDDYLYALNALTGKFEWKYKTGANVSTKPLIHNGVVYFGSSDGNIYALSAENGAVIWVKQTGTMINASSPCLYNNTLYLGNRSGTLYALNLQNGNTIWTYSTGGVSLEQSSPVISNGILYISGWYNMSFNQKGSIYAIDASSGSLIWKSLQLGFSDSPEVAKGRIFISADDANFYAVKASDGTPLWSKNILPNGSNASVANDVVYVASFNNIFAFEAETGKEKWKLAIIGTSGSKPCIVDNNGQMIRD
jgi:outer membrane protein assembly factor BamB